MSPASSQVSESHWAERYAMLPFSDEELTAISEFMGRTLFKRLWTWQEIGQANVDAIIMCSRDAICWQVFRAATFCIYKKPCDLRIPSFSERRIHAYNICDTAVYTRFIDLASRTKNCQCTDPRDRIYALLSMIASAKNTEIQPDYTKSFQDVYEEYFVKTVARTKSLLLLEACELQKSIHGMPTWVTNWSNPGDAHRLIYVKAAGFTGPAVSYPMPGVLRVSGLQVASIHRVERTSVSVGTSTIQDVLDELHKLALHLNINDDRFEEFYGTFCLNFFSHSFFPPSQHFPDVRGLFPAIHEAQTNQSTRSTAVFDYLYSYILVVVNSLHDRCFFTTNDGRFGLGPLGAQENDFLCVILGCDSLMIFRPTENGQFQVVGEAYCNGFMIGGAILGPLPAHLDPVFYIIGEGKARWSIIDNETKTAQRDPRLGELPAGWQFAEGSDELCPRFICVKDQGGTEPTFDGPRLTAHALKERGVDLKDFDLV